ncbi:hypothetical protein BRADI_3g40091v3 [Brachypodium distachyon]|uniref:Uncharacterized protein n=1 Tax=Brachypodium distachyon TaxID=15368 RepID=A0A0Q3IEF6_BRADI|nr:hypothetical protein BRADI_3g40091v3 [Brachypodium distachyon]
MFFGLFSLFRSCWLGRPREGGGEDSRCDFHLCSSSRKSATAPSGYSTSPEPERFFS